MKKIAILCVDDEKYFLNSLCTEIKLALGPKYRNLIIETAESPEEGLDVIDELTEMGVEVKVVISDWLMTSVSQVSGDAFLVNLHRLRPDIHKILVTGFAPESAVLNARVNAGLHGIYSKPWKIEELVRDLDILLAGMLPKAEALSA